MASVTGIRNCLIGVGYSKKEIDEMFLENPALDMDKLAATKFFSQREKKLLRAKRNAQLQALAMDRVETQMDRFLKKFPESRREALHSILTKGGHDFMTETVEGRYWSVRDQAMGNLSHAMAHHKAKWVNYLNADKDFGKKILREMRGKDTGDAMARAAAKDLGQVMEQLRVRYNKAGGDIGKISDWSAVQTHDALAMSKSGVNSADPAEWMAEISKHLDFDRMNLKKAEDIDAFLRETYLEITTKGARSLDPGAVPMDAKSALANRVGSRHRQFHFKDVEGYIDYSEKFGTKDHFSSMLAHIDSMSKDIALMETMGPNPQATFKYAQDKIHKLTGDRSSTRGPEKVFKDIMGETMAENHKVADLLGTSRALMAAGKLKLAVLSALSDLAFMGLESHMAGLPAMKVYGRLLKQMVSDGDKHLAARITGVSDAFLDTLAQNMRYSEITSGSDIINKMAATTIRGSGLEWLTNSNKVAFSLEMAAEAGSHLSTSFEKIKNQDFLSMMKSYRIDASDWKQLRKAAHKQGGVKYLDLSKIEDPDLAAKYSSMIRGEMKYAVPEPGWREQGILKQGTQAGTAVGETTRTFMQFKSFPITIMTTWWARILRSQLMDGTLSRAGYAGSMLALTSAMGVVSVTAKDVVKGRTPPPLDDHRTYARGILQGGSLGPIADFAADASKGRLLETLTGPLTGEAMKLAQTVSSNAVRFAEGKDTHLSYSLGNQLLNQLPGGPQTVLPMRRMMVEPLLKMTDPGKAQENARRADTRLKNEGQGQWWKQGETTPENM